MSILARSVREPSGNSPARIRSNRVEVLLDRAVAVGALAAGLGQRAAVLADLVGGQVAHVGLAGLDQLHGPLVELVEVVGGVEQPVLPVEAQPADVLDDRVDVFGLLLARVGVVEAQVAQAAELRGDAEVQADRLGVADVQVAVRLGREAGMDPPVVLAGPQVLKNDLSNEVGRARGVGGGIGAQGAHGFYPF